MASLRPMDWGQLGVGVARELASPVERIAVNVGQFTANTTVTKMLLAVDKKTVVRAIWVAGTNVPSDADGTCVLNVYNNDISEGPAADTLVSAQDLETLITVAKKGYALTLATEGTENELTLEAGDALYCTLVSNSAAIDTNTELVVTLITQALDPIDA